MVMHSAPLPEPGAPQDYLRSNLLSRLWQQEFYHFFVWLTKGTGGNVIDFADLLFFLEKPRALGSVPLKINEATVSQRIQLSSHLLMEQALEHAVGSALSFCKYVLITRPWFGLFTEAR